ncbi:hypothetical protein D3C76_1592500 [compost metagenome]
MMSNKPRVKMQPDRITVIDPFEERRKKQATGERPDVPEEKGEFDITHQSEKCSVMQRRVAPDKDSGSS